MASTAGAWDHIHYATHQWGVRNYCYFCIFIRAEDAVKLSSKVVIKMEDKIKQKGGGCGLGDTMKMVWDVRSVNDEKKSGDEVKDSQGCCLVQWT